MVLELHVHGPAFGLPSIDPQCLASIAYLSLALPKTGWLLVPSGGAGIAARELPALKDEDGNITAGYDNVIHYFSNLSPDCNLDAQLPSAQPRADSIAFSSHIHTHLAPLLSLSLYISSQNYALIRRAWTQLLPWPSQYYIPSSLRTLARSQSRHLSLSSLNLDAASEKEEETKKRESIIPERLRGLGKKSVSELLQREGGKERFRLDALIDAALEPLSELLGDKRWFLDEETPSSMDALALGYLSLALVPDMPSPWLRDGVRRYPNLCTFAEKGVKEIYGDTVNMETLSPEAQVEKPAKGALPWRVPPPISAPERITGFTKAMVDGIPFHPWKDDHIVPAHHPHTQRSTNPLPLPLFTAAAITAAAIAAYTYLGFNLGLSANAEEHKLGDMGEAGAMLNMFNFGSGEPETQSNESQREAIGEREGRVEVAGVGVESEVD